MLALLSPENSPPPFLRGYKVAECDRPTTSLGEFAISKNIFSRRINVNIRNLLLASVYTRAQPRFENAFRGEATVTPRKNLSLTEKESAGFHIVRRKNLWRDIE